MNRDAQPAAGAAAASEPAHTSGDEKLLQEQERQSKNANEARKDSWEAPACSWARTGEDGEDLMDAMSTKEIMLGAFSAFLI